MLFRSAVAIGASAGYSIQGCSAVAIGSGAGELSQGQNSIAIGAAAGQCYQAANTIILNARGSCFPLNGNAQTCAFYVAPVRGVCTAVANILYYCTGSKEIISGPQANSIVNGNSNIIIPVSCGPILLSSGGIANVLTINQGNIAIIGNITNTGNATFAANVNAPSSIFVNGTSYDAQVSITDVAADHVAQLLITRASTSVQALQAFAYNPSDDPLTNVAVTNGQTISSLEFLAQTGTQYGQFAQIDAFASNSGNIGDGTSNPGALGFNVTPDGSITPQQVLLLDQDLSATFQGNVSVVGNIIGAYLWGDGSNITNIKANNIVGGYGNANVAAYLSSGNVTTNIITTGQLKQCNAKIALGGGAGASSQGANSIAIGYNSGGTSQNTYSIAIGCNAGAASQGGTAIALGSSAGSCHQGGLAIAIGYQSGLISQAGNNISIGKQAGYYRQATNTVAIGTQSGYSLQGQYAIAIGCNAGERNQGSTAIAIGSSAAQTSQGGFAVAIGYQAGLTNQAGNSISIGIKSGFNSQQLCAVAIGAQAGYSLQGCQTVAIGMQAGFKSQSSNAIAIGSLSGYSAQGTQAVAIGHCTGLISQGGYSVAIGGCAGRVTQGNYSIAVGYQSGYSVQANNTIILNASGSLLTQTTANTFTVKPVRSVTGTAVVPLRTPPSGFFPMSYNPTTGEIIYWV